MTSRIKTGGRKQGTPNKVSGNLREIILHAFGKVGGSDYLARQAEENPTAFMSLLGKILPMQVAGHDGGELKIIVSTGVPRAND
jgi:hypothetical protein